MKSQLLSEHVYAEIVAADAREQEREYNHTAQRDRMALIGHVEALKEQLAKTEYELERYTRTLWHANGMLMMKGFEPVKLVKVMGDYASTSKGGK